MVSTNVEAIETKLLGKYKSFDDPQFFFVSEAIERDIYAHIVERLAERFAIEQDTDEDTDVSFFYHLKNSEGEWVLRLSMVGPYGMLLRIARGGKGKIVSEVSDSSPSEREIILILEESGIEMLDSEIMSAPLRIKLFNTPEKDTRVYQAVFSDSDVLPWEQVFPA